MTEIFKYILDIWANKSIRKKIIFTIAILVLYRLLVFIPVPFVDLKTLIEATNIQNSWWLEYFAMLLWWTLDQFSIIAVWLIPYINASIIMQLLTSVLPQLEDLQEQWEVWTIKIQQYTRRLAFPLAFLQSIWMVYFINHILWGNIINTSSLATVLLSAFVLTVWTVMLMWLWETITEKWISNWTSLIIFANIVAWISSKIFTYTSSNSWADLVSILLFMLIVVLVLVILSVLLIKTRKEIPIIHARHGKVQETAILPIPLNPVWMIPIIFSIAFVTFPYLLSQVITKYANVSGSMAAASNWISQNLNIYTQTPSMLVIFIYFAFIVLFTFFYTLIVFNPDKMADNIQKRWWFIPWIRPGEETAKYINSTLMHLCLWWWIWLWLIWIYSYILSYIPFIESITRSLGSIPVIVSGSWVIIIVWVVQDLVNKINADLVMAKYDRF